MVKWPFRRNDNTTEQPEYQVPSEIQSYYDAERRERTGVAWLMATGTLVVTILLAVGLFFGGRWIYRKVANNDPQPAVNTASVEQSPSANTFEEPQTSSTSTNEPSPAPTPPATAPSTSTPPATPSPTPTPASPAPTPSPSTLAANSQNSNLPNTGPGHVAATVALASVIGSLGHYVITNRSASRRNR